MPCCASFVPGRRFDEDNGERTRRQRNQAVLPLSRARRFDEDSGERILATAEPGSASSLPGRRFDEHASRRLRSHVGLLPS